jgi:hypothetical protein
MGKVPKAGSSQSAEKLQWMACFNTPAGGAADACPEPKQKMARRMNHAIVSNFFLILVFIDPLLNLELGYTVSFPIARGLRPAF